MKIKKWRPKKHTHKYKDFRQLCTYCITEFGVSSPEEAAYRINEEDWIHPDSDHSGAKEITKACKACWQGAKKDVDKIGKEDEQKKLSEPEKLAKAIEYVKLNVVLDVLKTTYVDSKTLEEVTPSDIYIRYNDMVSDKLYIQKFFFDTAFESTQIPKFDPIKMWADNLPKWDKKDHIKKLCSYIPAENPRQLELFLKYWLIRCYIQSVNPTNKSSIEIVNRHFLILQSDLESNGKSSFLFWLSPHKDWVKISGVEQGKDGKRAMSCYMLIVDDEMHGITQFKEAAAFKSLISMSKVDVRLPYGKKDSVLSRIASFCGSCNSTRLFPVGEQNTRFLCVPLKNEMFDFKGYTKNVDRSKLWAQVKELSKTTWLENNDAEVRQLRTATNTAFVRETMEQIVVDRHVRNSNGSTIMRTGDVLIKARELEEFKDCNLNINVLGSILTKTFGPPKKGVVDGVRTQGYDIEFCLTTPPKNDKKPQRKAIFRKSNG